MAEFVYIKDDLVSLRPDHGEPVGLVWGDKIEVLGRDGSRSRVRVHGRGLKPIEGTVGGKVRTQPTAVLQFSMVDVQQGDGMVIETPKGRKIFIDGGDNVLFARYCASRYPNTTPQDPLEVDAMVRDPRRRGPFCRLDPDQELGEGGQEQRHQTPA